jgi:hypothetical protein
MTFHKLKLFILPAALTAVLAAGCSKAKFAGDGTVVAEVGDDKITTAAWTKHLDLYRVVSPGVVDPSDPDHVKEVLESLIDQDAVLAAARKEKFTSADLDKQLNKQLPDAVQQFAQLREKLKKDLDAVDRLEKTFKDDYTKMLMAQAYAKSKVQAVVVTEKEIKDRYDQYATEAKAQGEKPKPYAMVRDQVKVRAMADKLLKQVREGSKIVRHEDAIQKYLATISPSQQALKEGK